MILQFFVSFCLLLSMGDGRVLKNASEQFNNVQDNSTSPKEPCDVLCHLIQDLTEQIEERITRQIQMRDTIVAFTARTGSTPLYLHQIISFPYLITNIGGGYDTELSVFRCPVKGLYEFTVSIRSQPHFALHTYISAAGVATVYTYSSGGSDWGMTTTSVLLQLNKGDNVNVRVSDMTAGATLASYSTFSGYLIRAM